MPSVRSILTILTLLIAVEGLVALWAVADRNDWSLPVSGGTYAQQQDDEEDPLDQPGSPSRPPGLGNHYSQDHPHSSTNT